MTLPASQLPPRATAEQALTLRKDLEASGWGIDAVAHILGPAADAALRREIRLPAVLAVREELEADRRAGATPNPIAVLTAVFMLGQEVSELEFDSALRRTRTAGALAMNLVELVEDSSDDAEPSPSSASSPAQSAPSVAPAQGAPAESAAADASASSAHPHAPRRVRALVDLRPHEVAGLTESGEDLRWWVASDLGELVTGEALRPDHVLGIGGAGLTLAGLTPRRRVARALDMGCGCGIQSLYLAQHAEHVIATDISERALAFTAFNAALAGMSAERLEIRQGSFLQPVAGERFDLIATNPPFVLTPAAVREAGLPLMEYRDAGQPVLPALVPALEAYLEVGGTAVMLGNWEQEAGEPWESGVRPWLPESLDAWVIQREIQDPVEYATMWLRDGGFIPERDPHAFDAALAAWIQDFAARSIEAIGFGYLILHRPDPAMDGAAREPWRVLEEVPTSGEGALGEHIARSIEIRSGLAAMSDDAVAQLAPVLAPDVTEERHLVPGEEEPRVILLRQGGGFARTIQSDTALSALASVADGELSVHAIAAALAALLGVDEAALRVDLVAAVRQLAVEGFVEL